MNFFKKKPANYQHMNISTYRDDFAETDHMLVDVRTTSEYNRGHLPGAINIPMDQINARIDEISKEKPVVFVCASGNRSGSVTEALANAGYDNVYNLDGGTMNWMMLGLSVDK